MTDSLSRLTHTFFYLNEQLFQISEQAEKVRHTGYCEGNLESYLTVQKEIEQSIENMQSQVEKVANFVEEPFKSTILEQYQLLKQYSSETKLQLDQTLPIQKITMQCGKVLHKLPSLKNASLAETEKLKAKNFKIVVTPGLNAQQLKWTVEFHNNIIEKQNRLINNILLNLKKRIADALSFRNTSDWTLHSESIDSIRKILYDDLPSLGPIGLEVQQTIFQTVWIKAGKPEWDLNFGGNHALDDLDSLLDITTQFSAAYNQQTNDSSKEEKAYYGSSESEEEVRINFVPTQPTGPFVSLIKNSDEENESSPEDQAEFTRFQDLHEEPISPENSIDSSPSNLKSKETSTNAFYNDWNGSFITKDAVILSDFKIFLYKIISLPSGEKRESEINEARSCLPDPIRHYLDGRFYELSEEPSKGGLNWGDQNAAKDPILLLKIVEDALLKGMSWL